MTITLDKVANAVYLRVSSREVTHTQAVNDRLIVDVDAAGDLIGIEILDASAQSELLQELERSASAGLPLSIPAQVSGRVF